MELAVRLHQVEEALVRLADAQSRTEAAIARLAEAQARTEERVGRLEVRMEQVEAALARLAEAQARTEERVGRLEVRMEQVEAALARLAEAQARTEERVGRLEVRMEQVEAALARLAEAQARTEERVGRLEVRMEQVEAALARLAEAQARTEEQLVQLVAQVTRQDSQLQALLSWQRGEAGRREGERYERDVVRRAGVLFNGGHGGPPDQPDIQRHLTALLRTLLTTDILPAQDDPSLADLLWWKGDQLAVVETALQVNGEDVSRAAQRAGTLRRSGTQAIAVVIGEHWATLDTRERARMLGVDWKVGADLSDGFLAFRRLPHAENGIG